MAEDIRGRVLKHLLEAADTEMTPEEVSPQMLLRENLGLDSLAAVQMVMELEDEFDVNLPDKELTELKTVGDVYRLVEKKQKLAQEE